MLSKIQAHSFSQSMPESATSTRYSGTQNHSKLGQGLKFLLIAALAIFVTACGGGGGGGPTPGPVTLTSIAITPPSDEVDQIVLAKGEESTLTAVGTFSSGPPSDITTQVAWFSGDPDIAGVDEFTGAMSVD